MPTPAKSTRSQTKSSAGRIAWSTKAGSDFSREQKTGFSKIFENGTPFLNNETYLRILTSV